MGGNSAWAIRGALQVDGVNFGKHPFYETYICLMAIELIDTHAHLYLPAFADDMESIVERLLQAGVSRVLLPNIDVESYPLMMDVCARWPQLFVPMLGLHPCDVKADWHEALIALEAKKNEAAFCAVGEIGMDLYWDTSFQAEQVLVFERQIEWAKDWDLPIVIHARDAFDPIFEVLDRQHDARLRGVFHCFTGTLEQARRIQGYGSFMMGIGGVLTYPKSGLADVVREISLDDLVLETDSPFLPPVPYRGKRNETSYVRLVAEALAGIQNCSLQEVAERTTINAKRMFRLVG
jgi:TatD DNase family protein